MADFVVAVILLTVIGGAVAYIRKSKKSGVKCIGCPEGAKCPGSSGCAGCGCGCQDRTE